MTPAAVTDESEQRLATGTWVRPETWRIRWVVAPSDGEMIASDVAFGNKDDSIVAGRPPLAVLTAHFQPDGGFAVFVRFGDGHLHAALQTRRIRFGRWRHEPERHLGHPGGAGKRGQEQPGEKAAQSGWHVYAVDQKRWAIAGVNSGSGSKTRRP